LKVFIKFYAGTNHTPEIELTIKNEETGDIELYENFCFDDPNDAATALGLCIKIIQALGAKLGRDLNG